MTPSLSNLSWTPAHFSALLAQACQETDLIQASDIIIASVHVCFCIADFRLFTKEGELNPSNSFLMLPKAWNATASEYLSFVYKHSNRLYHVKFLIMGNHVLVHAMESNDKENIQTFDFETHKLVSSDLIYPIRSASCLTLTKSPNSVESFLLKCKNFISGIRTSEIESYNDKYLLYLLPTFYEKTFLNIFLF
ncbi:hypothetical protein HMI56_002871 [Coelomomyces lativittatus]|nr:hypothetical protein HMI56_002871 [Coelomomyces lativittatus]